MQSARLISSICLLLAAASAHAQLYKWVGPDGKVTYSDTPPPQSVKQVETESISGGSNVDTNNLPYELAQAVKSHPVTLYTAPDCSPCDAGRTMLNKRGIPFSEKTIGNSNDAAQLKHAGGGSQLPFLTVGREKQEGFEANAWNLALTAAGYPQSSQLPPNYVNPQAQPAAPKIAENKAPKDPEEQEPPLSESLPAPAGNAPPGFHF